MSRMRKVDGGTMSKVSSSDFLVLSYSDIDHWGRISHLLQSKMRIGACSAPIRPFLPQLSLLDEGLATLLPRRRPPSVVTYPVRYLWILALTGAVTKVKVLRPYCGKRCRDVVSPANY